jgi:hypothetical protein
MSAGQLVLVPFFLACGFVFKDGVEPLPGSYSLGRTTPLGR